ncbi:Fic family protein [Levilactobacillus fujinensis]|uniref:Filamentation induced by cAMP protein fic n=2 Tax=Levilactobacillus fujinensis TaxID=2486024 RepID=A0ABW1TKB6_9LACO|nr:filamentation induced by cAMP protein fic [Levilactobacillus fujinensis]
MAKKNLVNLVFSTSKFEGTRATLSQTRTIIEGLGVSGVTTDDIITIVNLKRGWQFVITNDAPYVLAISNQINVLVAKNDSLEPGHVRAGNVMLDNTEYVPPVPEIARVAPAIRGILEAENKTFTERLLDLLLTMMCQQFYWDGNKRTAFLTINYLAIDAGVGLFNINESQLEAFNNLLATFYETGNGDDFNQRKFRD